MKTRMLEALPRIRCPSRLEPRPHRPVPDPEHMLPASLAVYRPCGALIGGAVFERCEECDFVFASQRA